jgi:hypothetical protein
VIRKKIITKSKNEGGSERLWSKLSEGLPVKYDVFPKTFHMITGV